MRYAIAVAALAGLTSAMPRVTSPAEWTSIWQSQLASMASVQSEMGKPRPTYAAIKALSKQGIDSKHIPKYDTVVIGGTKTQTQTMTGSLDPIKPGKPKGQRPPPPNDPRPSRPDIPGSAPTPQPPPSQATGKKLMGAAAWKPGEEKKGPVAREGYTCYPKAGGSAGPEAFPARQEWATFESLWAGNQEIMKNGCKNNGWSPNNTPEQIAMIKEAIMTVAYESLVDPRIIFIHIIQESKGCLACPTTNNGNANPGIMQSHAGVSFVGAGAPKNQQKQSILQMIRDGTSGTPAGDGIVQLMNRYGDVYTAARAYNSGENGLQKNNLNAAYGSTASYVNDIANRLTGWALNPAVGKTCPGESG